MYNTSGPRDITIFVNQQLITVVLSAILMYKQAVLPSFDYGGFLLVSCDKSQKKDLQVLQNNALRISLRYRLGE